jgi:uncharacterized protein YecE (DUF72 family)
VTVTYHVGTSGFSYNHWRERFYPKGLPQSQWLEFYAKEFSTVELNNTFYRLPPDKSFDRWRERTPQDFVYAVKVSRFITHIKKLRNSDDALQKFLASAHLLGIKLGPLLYQLPPSMSRNESNESVLEAFLKLLPHGLSHVIEFRHESWLHEEVLDLLRQHQVGFCIFDMPDLTAPVAATADFAYVRFHGSAGMYGSSYSDEELKEWADKITGLAEGLRAVYVYFNNDIEGFAVRNAITLREYLTNNS